MSFGVASALGGVGGIVYVAELGIASPGDFSQLLAIFFIVGLVVGGVGTLSGAVVGGFVIAFVPEWSSSTTDVPGVPARWLQGPTGTLVLGLLLILLTFVLPGGIVAGVRKMRARIVRVQPTPPTSPAAAGTGTPLLSNDTPEQADEPPSDPTDELEDMPASSAPPG
jgi:branched-chain amino acid transport system permease protein